MLKQVILLKDLEAVPSLYLLLMRCAILLMLGIVEQYSVLREAQRFTLFHMIISPILRWKRLELRKLEGKSINQ